MPTGADLEKLVADARRAAAFHGDENPSRIDVVSTTAQLAQAEFGSFLGGSDDGNMPVYVVIDQGSFTCDDCSGNILTTIAGIYDSSGNGLAVVLSGPKWVAEHPLDSTIAKLGPSVTIEPVQAATS